MFAGDRADEFEARMEGRRYEAGGIRRTVRLTREADDANFQERQKTRRELAAQKAKKDREVQEAENEAARNSDALDKVIKKDQKAATDAANFAADAGNKAEANAAKAARDAEAKAKRDAAQAKRDAAANRPGAQQEAAAKPLIDKLVGEGVHPGDANKAVMNEMQRLMAHGLSLQQAKAQTDAQIPAFLMQYAHRLQVLEMQEAQRRMQMQQIGANRGGGLPALQNTVPGWR